MIWDNMMDMNWDMGQDIRSDKGQDLRSDVEVMKLNKEAMEHSDQLSSTLISISNYVLYPVKQIHKFIV